MFRAAGFEDEVQELRLRQKEKDREGALAAITEQMIQSINFIGNKEEVTAFTNSYLEAGVEYPILMPMPWGENRKLVTQLTLEAMAAINQ